MGILRYGEKRVKGSNGDSKDIKVNKIGWKRIAKNTCCFGWMYVNPEPYDDSDEIIAPYAKKGKTKVELLFVRADAVKASNSAIQGLETFYNILFLIRRILAFLLPILLVVGVVLAVLNGSDAIGGPIALCLVPFLLWLACIIGENMLARSAKAKLNRPTGGSEGRKNVPQKHKSPNGGAGKASADTSDDDDDIITLQNAKGEEIDFVDVAGIAHKGNFYAIMQPVELLDGMDDNEALVFKVTRGRDGEDKFEIELDDATIDAVFEKYNQLLDEAEKNSK